MTNQAERWMTIREAALALNLSELTVRRRIKDGRLAHRLVDGKYFVRLEHEQTSLAPSRLVSSVARRTPRNGHKPQAAADEPTTAEESRDSFPGPFDIGALLTEHGRLSAAAGRAALLQEQLRALEERNRALQEGLVSLATRNGWLESRLEEREQHIRLLTDEHRKRSWWRRVFSAREAGA